MNEKKQRKYAFLYDKSMLFLFVFASVFLLAGISGLVYKMQKQKIQAIPQELQWAVKQALLSDGAGSYEGDIPITGFSIVDVRQSQDTVRVYAVASFCNYRVNGSEAVSGAGYFCEPAVLRFSTGGKQYMFQDISFPTYGESYGKTLKSLFNEDLYDELVAVYYSSYQKIAGQMEENLEEYVKNYNLDTGYSDRETDPLRVGAILSAEPLPVVNSALISLLSSDFAMYPPYAGERTVVVNGEGVTFKIAYQQNENDSKKGTYTLTKSINGVVAEAHRILVTKDTAVVDETYLYSKPTKIPVSTEPICYAQNRDGVTAFVYQEANSRYSLNLQTGSGQKAVYLAGEGSRVVFPLFSPVDPIVAFISAKSTGEPDGYSGELMLYNYEKDITTNTGITIFCDSQMLCGYEFTGEGKIAVRNGELLSSPGKTAIGFYDIKTAVLDNIAKTDSNSGRATVSPDGKLMVYTNFNQVTKQKELMVYYVSSGDKKAVLTEALPEINTSVSFPTYFFVDKQNILIAKAAGTEESPQYRISLFDVVTLVEQPLIENAMVPCYDGEEKAVYYVDTESMGDIYRYDMSTGESAKQPDMTSPFDSLHDD